MKNKNAPKGSSVFSPKVFYRNNFSKDSKFIEKQNKKLMQQSA